MARVHLGVTVEKEMDRELREEASRLGMNFSEYIRYRLEAGGREIRRQEISSVMGSAVGAIGVVGFVMVLVLVLL